MPATDRGLLKKELYQDQGKLMDAVAKEVDLNRRALLLDTLDLVNKYILICVKRKKF